MPYAATQAEAAIKVTGEAPPPWWEQAYLGVPLWIWILGGVGGAAVVGAAVYEQSREEREMMMMMR